jgi:hypothetical protein
LDLYRTAMLDDDPTKLSERIKAAHKAIHHRLVVE